MMQLQNLLYQDVIMWQFLTYLTFFNVILPVLFASAPVLYCKEVFHLDIYLQVALPLFSTADISINIITPSQLSYNRKVSIHSGLLPTRI